MAQRVQREARGEKAGSARGPLAVSAIVHGLLVLTVAVTLAGDLPPIRAEFRTSFVTTAELPPEPPRPEPQLRIPPDPAPARLDEEPPPEEASPFKEPLFKTFRVPLTLPVALAVPGHRVNRIRAAAPPPPPLPPPPPAPVRSPPPEPAPVVRGPTRTAVPRPDNPPPVYPRTSRRAGHEGVVVLLVFVRPDGSVRQVEIARTSGRAPLDREAVRAVSSWRFTPALKNGLPVAAKVEQRVRFSLLAIAESR